MDKAAAKAKKTDDGLKMLIQSRQNQRQQTFFSALEAKYLNPKEERKKKRGREVGEPSEEDFERNAKKRSGSD
jgi:hypothetical protein